MKIIRASTKKLAPLPPALATMVQHVVNDADDQIKWWANLNEWKFPRGDLFQFIAVLNRFDAILQTICEEYGLVEKHIQKTPFRDETKQTLLAVLNLSRLLFENCTNRNLYNSYEHLNNLLNTTDIDILEAVLKFMLKPAQRVNNPKAVQSSFLAPQDKVTELARGGSIPDLMSTVANLDNTISMSFYRTGDEEGLQVVNLKADQSMTDLELFWKTVQEYRIPVDYHFELLNRIRIANHVGEPHVRKQLLIIRFISIVIMAHTMSETIAQNRVFIYEPHLVQQIAQLVCYDDHIPIDIQTYALYALDGISRHRVKVTEVLAAFNVSANHGILLHILRQSSQGSSVYTVSFLDALFTLLSFLFQTQAGGQMLMSAGIMSTLIQIMDNTEIKTDIHTKVLIKVVGLLDTIMNNINTSFSSFCSANGLESLLKVIQTRVDDCIQKASIDHHDSLTLVKNSLRFLIRMMESSDTADGLRNLIESSIPHTLKRVMQHHSLFGSSVFSLVANVATTFIHNEPTSLSVLQEIQLPQTFLRAFVEYNQPNCDVLMAAVHAFGAICLNSAGLAMFNEARPLPHFFKLMTMPSFVTNPAEVGGVTVLGTTMDELIRHHPSLKQEVFVCANQLLLQVIHVGHSEEGKPVDNCHLLVQDRQAQDMTNERAECLLLGHVDLVARFLEGFLRNSENIKEFINYNGPELLLRYYSLPMLPYNFSISNAFDSLSFVFRMISDVSPMPVADLIAKKAHASSQFIMTDLDHSASVVFKYLDSTDPDTLKKGNELYRKFSVLFGYIGLLSTVFASAILTNSKHAVKLVEWAVSSTESHGNLIQMLGDIHRTMVWQNILLRESVPKAWYNTTIQESQDGLDLKDPVVINIRRFKLLLSEIPPALMPVLQGIIKVSVNRRPLSSSQLSLLQRAQVVAEQIAQVFKSNFLYMRDDSPICKYDYYASMFSMTSMLLLDDRSRSALETPIAVAFNTIGNVDLLIETLLPQFWLAAETEIARNAQSEDGTDLQRINTCIELLLAISHHLGSSKMFHNSPHTNILTMPDPETTLDPHHWMASMQLKLSSLYKFLQSPLLNQFSRQVLHSLLSCLTQNMKAEGERSRHSARHVHHVTPATRLSDHDANRAALIEMGFDDTSLTDSALRQFDDNGIAALDYLFSRRLVEHPVHHGPPQLDITPHLRSSHPLTSQEYEPGVRILVNMWYDQETATEILRQTNNLAEAATLLSVNQPSAIRTPAITSNSQLVEGDDDDEYEDIDSEEEESVVDDTSRKKLTKKEIAETLEKLDSVRKTMREAIPQILALLVDKRSDIDFEVRDLMVVLCCGDQLHLPENTKQTIHLFFGGSDNSAKDKRALFESSINKIRIFALMLREPAMQDVMSLLITTMSEFMGWFEFLDMIVTYPNFPDPKWLTTLFLILEAGLAQADEPKEEPMPTIDGLATDDTPTTPAIVTPENRATLMNYCINLLNMETLSQDNLISTLRIVVRLTKHHAAAAQFVALGGLPLLFKRPRQSLEAIKIQQAYLIMILRHIIEDKPVLMQCMKEWFSFWFTVPTSRFLDVSTFIRNNHSIALRDPEAFVQVGTELCRLSNYKQGNIKNISYVGDKVESSSDTTHSSLVVDFLLTQLVETQAIEQDTNVKVSYTGFLLQCLLELVSSYPSCKNDVIEFNNSHVDAAEPSIRQSVIFTLVNDLLPFKAINPTTDQERKKQVISMWVASLLVAMCHGTAHKYTDDSLTEIRKHVLDVIYRSFKDALGHTGSTSAKYTRYFALAELCHRILNARPASINPAAQTANKEDTAVAQLMLEKKFVPVLISVVSNVDVNYPHAKMILNSILRPLEQLTKLAIKIDRTTLEKTTEDEENHHDVYLPMDMDEENEAAEEEVSDLYRNSSLAMYDGTALEEESGESSEDDMEMASSGDEIIQDEDDDESNSSSDSYETVNSSEEEGQEEEMDELMRSHRFHISDTEENDTDSSNDNSDSETESEASDSSTSYASSNESLNSDRSESVHSEESGDMGWHLDHLNDEHHRHRRQHESRQTINVDDIFNSDNDDMDVDRSDLDEDDVGSDDLDQEEIEDVERNLELFARGEGIHMINPGIRGSLNTATGTSNGPGRSSSDRDNIILHPLLRNAANTNTTTSADGSFTHETAILSGTNSSHLQAYEDIIGGSAVRILENLLSQQQQRNNAGEAQPAAAQDVSQESKDVLNLLQEFQPMQTADRWIQEVQMVYISSVASAKATKLTNTLIARLVQIAKTEVGPVLENDENQPPEFANEDDQDYMQVDEEDLEGLDGDEEVILSLDIDEEDNAEEEESLPQERVFVSINDQQVDITGTGIDAEFLEALPDDLRAEVLSQQMAERRSSIQSIEQDAISSEFLDALPPDIRDEVIRQESRLQARQQSPSIAVNVTELNGQQMHPNLGLSSRVEFDFNPTTSNAASIPGRNDVTMATGPVSSNTTVTKKVAMHKDAIRIVDRSQLATLARLLFVPQSISKALLNRLLLNLCENSKTRADLLSLLICILQDGSSDLAAVDRSFSQLSIHIATAEETVPEANDKKEVNAPNLITQRCLEILYYVVTWNDRSLAYFLTENDTLGHLKRRPSVTRKSKTIKYPILILIGLLDRSAICNNTTLMGQLVNLLATMCRPFPSLVKKHKEKEHHHAPPTIPEQYIHKIVDVLTMGECTSYTFQNTLSVLSHLSALDGALDTIIHALISAANASGQQIIIDLQQLHMILSSYKPGTGLKGSALAQFSAATSHQTKLLRVLKAMDYLYTRKRSTNSNNKAEENEKLVLQIYDKLEFLPLWKMLGSCLSVIRDREDLLNVATVLLPLVESFMAVSKYSTNKGYSKTTKTDDFFLTFTEEHKKILNIMVRNNPSLMSGSFSLLVHNPKILEFDNKRSYFSLQLHKRTEPREHHPALHLNVRRAHVFEDTYRQLQGRTGKEIKYGKLNVQFHNEEGVDAGGVAREWFSVLARQMFDPNYALFITSAADKLTYQPNRASGVNSDHLSYFKCVGRIIGKAIHDGRLLDAYFTRSFYKLMLGRSVDYRDVEAVDPAYYKSLVWMLENDITDIIDLTFSVETDDFGTNKVIDLKLDGRNIPVTEANKHEYVTLITEQKLVLAIKEQVNAFLEGFHDIIPSHLIQIFNEQELELLISGLPDIDIDEWKANTIYEGYSLSSPQIQWFWRAVRSFDQEERAKLLQFSTGTSKVPLEGFAELQGSNGVQKFQIHKEFGDNNRLPSAHTCFNQIDLPQYQSYDDLRTNLFKAISECSTGFAFQ